MTPELELAQRRVAELEAQLKALRALSDEELHVLPNGDLHRGIQVKKEVANVDTISVPETSGNPLNRAMARILEAAKGGHALTCLWCGIQWDGAGAEKDVREHLKKDHASVIEGHDKIASEILMANLVEAKARLGEEITTI